MKQTWQTYNISSDETHHTTNNQPVYEKRFQHVLKFHSPGIAPVLDETGAYHIDPLGNPIYPQRYRRTFGFYCNLAAVQQDDKWFHLTCNGTPLYKEKYAWCGNFQENLSAIKDSKGRFFHINNRGERCYPQSYSYVGDFHDGVAVAQTDQGLHIHINNRGEQIHPHEFLDLDVFHKGFARAKDSAGYHHITLSGSSLYKERYAAIEPFYNGIARVETKWGAILLINENGAIVNTLRQPTRDPFHEVSADLVSYWKFFTLQTAHDLKIFHFLPASSEVIARKIHLSIAMTQKMLLALQECGYITQNQSMWKETAKGTFLVPSHPFSLDQAQELWNMEHFACWQKLTSSLKEEKCVFASRFNMRWFDFLNENPDKRKLYHQVLSKYAKRDYSSFPKKINFSSFESIVDIGGGTGALLQMLLEAYPHLEGHLLDLPLTLDEMSLSPQLKDKIKLHPLDFFSKWPNIRVDAAILCRIIHDWPDEEAIHILKQTRLLLKESPWSRLYIVENQMNKKTGNGGLLNLNMWVMTGGKERTQEELMDIFKESGFSYESSTALNEVSSIFALRPLK